MKAIPWTAFGAAISLLTFGVPDLPAGMRTGAVRVSATVLDRCVPSSMTLAGGAYAVRSTPYTAWTVAAGGESGAMAAREKATSGSQAVRNNVCRISAQQAAVPAIHRDGVVVTINF